MTPLQVPPIQLTDDQINDAENALMVLNRLIPQIDALEACGIECAQRRNRLNAVVKGLESLLQQFGGHR